VENKVDQGHRKSRGWSKKTVKVKPPQRRKGTRSPLGDLVKRLKDGFGGELKSWQTVRNIMVETPHRTGVMPGTRG